MTHIDITCTSPDVDWADRADLLTLQLLCETDKDVRNAIIDDNNNLWTELKDFLLNISNNKCWYSESKDAYNHLHVDHFRPKKIAMGLDKKDKGGYWWLAFEWTNYRVTGGAGNVKKKDKFAVRQHKCEDPDGCVDDELFYFLDPCEEEDVLKLTFNEHGEAVSIYKAGWDYERASYTIENLNLNFKLLKEARKNVWTKCSTLIREAQNLMSEMDARPSAKKRGQIKEKIKQLKQFVANDAEFSATARTCLQCSGLPWAQKIAA